MDHTSRLLPAHFGSPLRGSGRHVCSRARTREADCHRSISIIPGVLNFTRWLCPVCIANQGKVWCDLGLELRLELSVLQGDSASSTTLVYSIQHSQQQSGLFVPRDVPCGYLSEFSCSFRFAARTSTAPGNVEESLPRSRSHAHYGLRKLAETPSKPRSETTAAFWSLAPNVQAERVTHLTHHALNLVLGMKKRSPGIRYLKRTKPPALLELAPGVWNAQYFQVSQCDKSHNHGLTREFRMSLLGRSWRQLSPPR